MTLEQALLAAIGALAAAVAALFFALQRAWAERAKLQAGQADELRNLVREVVEAVHDQREVVGNLTAAIRAMHDRPL